MVPRVQRTRLRAATPWAGVVLMVVLLGCNADKSPEGPEDVRGASAGHIHEGVEDIEGVLGGESTAHESGLVESEREWKPQGSDQKSLHENGKGATEGSASRPEESTPRKDPYELPEAIVFAFDEGGRENEKLVVDTTTYANEVFKHRFGVEVTEATVFVYSNIDGLRTDVPLFLGEPVEHLNIHEGIQGQAWPRAIGIYTGGEPPPDHLITHELFHVLQFQLMYPDGGVRPLAPPAWLAEGSAEYGSVIVATEQFRASKDRLLQERIGDCRGADVSLADLEEAPGREIRRYDYCLGVAAANMLAEKAGDAALAEFWHLRGETMNWQEAFEIAFGLPVADFYAEFDAWNRG